MPIDLTKDVDDILFDVTEDPRNDRLNIVLQINWMKSRKKHKNAAIWKDR